MASLLSPSTFTKTPEGATLITYSIQTQAEGNKDPHDFIELGGLQGVAGSSRIKCMAQFIVPTADSTTLEVQVSNNGTDFAVAKDTSGNAMSSISTSQVREFITAARYFTLKSSNPSSDSVDITVIFCVRTF